MKSLELPLNRADKLASIRTYLTKLPRRDQLFLPDEETYPEIINQESLTILGKKLCVWLGVKPYNLRFVIEPDCFSGYQKEGTHHTIRINTHDSKDIFYMGAIVGTACLEYFFARQRQTVDSEYIELASIEFGLGILIINSCRSTTLKYLKPSQYAQLFNQYLESNQYDFKIVLEHTVIQARASLSKRRLSTRLVNQPYVDRQHKLNKTNQVKFASLFALGIVLVVVGFFVWTQRPVRLPAELQEQKERIAVLFDSYEACLQRAEVIQQGNNDDDIFTKRHVDAQMGRCVSIRNEHDFLVKDFNQKLSELKN